MLSLAHQGSAAAVQGNWRRPKRSFGASTAALRAKRPRIDRGAIVVASAQDAASSWAQQERGQAMEIEVVPLTGPSATGAAPAAPSSSPPPSLPTSTSSPEAAAPSPAPAAPAPVLVAFEVPGCKVAFGEHLRIVGAAPELGAWAPAAAPALTWGPGDCWAGQVALPPGQHELKLVRCRPEGANGCSGSLVWEDGPNRQLRVPELAGGGSGGEPLLSVVCRFGATEVSEVAVDQEHLQAVADAAAARVADLMWRKAELAARLERLEAEVVESESAIASATLEAQRLISADLARHAQQGTAQQGTAQQGAAQQGQQRIDRLDEQASAAEKRMQAIDERAGVQFDAGAARKPSPVPTFAPKAAPKAAPGGWAGPFSWSWPGAGAGAAGKQGQKGEAAAAMAEAVAEARREEMARPLACPDGSFLFTFSAAAPAAAASSSSSSPAVQLLSASDLAVRSLVPQLPAPAAAALERRLSSRPAEHRLPSTSLPSSSLPSSSRSVSLPTSSSNGSGSASSGTGSGRELARAAVSAAAAALAVPTNERLAAKVSKLRREVAMRARQAADLAEEFEMLMASHGRRPGGTLKARGSTGASAIARQRASLLLPQGSCGSGATAMLAAPAASAALSPVGNGSAAAVLASSAAAAAPAGRTRRAVHEVVPEVMPPLAGAGSYGLQGASPSSAALSFYYDATTRASFPIAAACVAAETVYNAGASLWSMGRQRVPRSMRGLADVAFWAGFATLAVYPLLS